MTNLLPYDGPLALAVEAAQRWSADVGTTLALEIEWRLVRLIPRAPELPLYRFEMELAAETVVHRYRYSHHLS